MQINYLGNQHSVLNEFVAELRDVTIQHDRLRFRQNIERVGQIMAYEISKVLPYESRPIQTPLGNHDSYKLTEQPVLATILRAGLSMHHGLLSFFDQADCAFISAYRKHTDAHSFEIVVEYLACPEIDNRTLLLIDPMLATGQSIELTYKALLKRGTPAHLHIVCLLASRQGVEYLQQHLPHATLWLAAIDEHLNDDGYIVPGLGDAGDLCFGEKV